MEELNFDIEFNFEYGSFKELNEVAGIYFIFDEDDELCYVGISKNLGIRLDMHASEHSQFGGIRQFFKTVKIIKNDSAAKRQEFEQYIIKKYSPRFNVTHKNIDLDLSHEVEIRRLNRHIDWLKKENEQLKERIKHLSDENHSLSIKSTQFECGYTLTDTWLQRASGGEMMGIDSVIVGFTNRLDSDIFRKTFKKLCYDSKQLRMIMGMVNEYDPFKAFEKEAK